MTTIPHVLPTETRVSWAEALIDVAFSTHGDVPIEDGSARAIAFMYAPLSPILAHVAAALIPLPTMWITDGIAKACQARNIIDRDRVMLDALAAWTIARSPDIDADPRRLTERNSQ